MAFIALNSIIHRRLTVFIPPVKLTAVGHKQLHHIKVAVQDSVVNRVLPIHVNVLHRLTLVNKEFDQPLLAFSASVVERSLLEIVNLFGIDALLDQLSHDLDGGLLIPDQGSSEE